MTLLLSIFKWVLYSTALGSILACVIIVFKLLFKERLGVRWHYCIWLLLVIRMMIPYGPQSSMSVFNIFYIGEQKITQINDISNSSITDTIIEPAESEFPISIQEKDHIHTENIIVPKSERDKNTIYEFIKIKDNYVPIYFKLACVIWIIGTIILGGYAVTVNINFRHKLKREENCREQHILELLSQCKCKIGLKTNITILKTDLVKSPAVFGFIRPKLLLPRGIDEQITLDELKYIIFHEMSHIKRKDIPVNCITCILQILHWFNPIIWYSFYRMRQDREVACDALALSYFNPEECIKYGQTLIKLLESYRKTKGVYGMTCIINNKSEIKRRITMISLFKKNSYRWSIIPIVVLIVMGGIMLSNPKKNMTLTSDKKSDDKIEITEGKIVDRNEEEIIDEKDIIGVKEKYDEYLSPSKDSPSPIGKDVVLTLDNNIQNFCEKAAEKALCDNKAKAVSIIVMNPNNGEVLSMVNRGDNDSNSSNEDEKNTNNQEKKCNNRAIGTAFEHGSLFKVITAAAAISEKVVDLDTYEIECNGEVQVGPLKVHCHKRSGHGTLNFQNMFRTSCNIGYIDLGQKLGAKKLSKYIEAFGFGEKAGIDLPGEVKGIVKRTENMSPLHTALMSMGQVNTATPIQYLTAFNAGVNGGIWIRPHIMKEIIHYDNKNKIVDKAFDNYGAKQILNEEAASKLRYYIEKISFYSDHSTPYLEKYNISGVIGTSQKVIDGIYKPGKYIASFVSMATLKETKKPQFTVYVSIDEPDPSRYYASQTASPVGMEIFKYITSYYGGDTESSEN